jgi:hypothetical protein
VRLAALVGMFLCAAPALSSAQVSASVPDLAAAPFTANALAEGNLAYLQAHVLQWVRRWGQPVDGPKEVEERLGPQGLAQLSTAPGPYAALLTGYVSLTNGNEWTAVLTVTGLSNGLRWAELTVTASGFQEFLDGLSDKSRAIAEVVATKTGRPVVKYVPPTRPYATVPLILGGAALVTGVTFFALAAGEEGKIGPGTSLADAVSARNTGNTYNIVGYTLSAVGVVGIVVGVFLFKPGASPAPPPVSVSVDPAHGMLLFSGPLP